MTPSLAQAHDESGGSSEASGSTSKPRLAYAYASESLRDLQPTIESPLDQASARAIMVGYRSSAFSLSIKGIDRAAAGEAFGAHLHIGPCVDGDPAAAGPHYNIDAVNEVDPPIFSNQTEVWLDFTVLPDGRGSATAKVPFVPEAGVRSIVIHAEPTQPNGSAGARLVCLPLKIH